MSGSKGNSNKQENGKKHRSDNRPSHAQSQSALTGDYFPAKPTLSGENGRTKASHRNRNKASQSGGQDSHQSKQSRSKSLDVVNVQHQRPGADRHRRRQPPTEDVCQFSEDEIFLREQRPQQRPQQRQSRTRHRREEMSAQTNGWFANSQHHPSSR